MLPGIQNNTQFAIFCFVVRGFEAVGAGAFSTASFIYVIHMFPDNVSAVLVSTAAKNANEIFQTIKTRLYIFLGSYGNFRRSRNVYRTRIWRLFIRGKT